MLNDILNNKACTVFLISKSYKKVDTTEKKNAIGKVRQNFQMRLSPIIKSSNFSVLHAIWTR